MDAAFKGKRISGILSILPETESLFDDEVGNYDFPPKQTLRLKKIMGFNKHRLAKEGSTASAFCIAGLNYLLESRKIKKEEIGAFSGYFSRLWFWNICGTRRYFCLIRMC